MRLIHSASPASGGPAEGAWQIDAVLERQGHGCLTISLDAPGSAWLASAPTTLHAAGPGWSTYGYRRGLQDCLRSRAEGVQAILVEGLWQYHAVAARRLARALKVPYFVFPHGMLDPWFRDRYPLKHFKKLMYWKLIEQRILRDAAAVFFTCEEERRLAGSCFRPYVAREQVIGHGTTAPRAPVAALREAFLSTCPDLRGRRFWVFLGRLHEKKGCDLLIEAFGRLAAGDPQLHLVMAGPDQEGLQQRLARRASELGVAERIRWTGMLAGHEKWGALAAAELFVLPSHQENFGIAIVEAMAVGCPVLITDKVNIWREIAADGAGLVCRDDADSLETALRHWLALAPQERAAMGQRAQACFRERFEIQRMVERMLAVIEGAVRGGNHLGAKPGVG